MKCVAGVVISVVCLCGANVSEGGWIQAPDRKVPEVEQKSSKDWTISFGGSYGFPFGKSQAARRYDYVWSSTEGWSKLGVFQVPAWGFWYEWDASWEKSWYWDDCSEAPDTDFYVKAKRQLTWYLQGDAANGKVFSRGWAKTYSSAQVHVNSVPGSGGDVQTDGSWLIQHREGRGSWTVGLSITWLPVASFSYTPASGDDDWADGPQTETKPWVADFSSDGRDAVSSTAYLYAHSEVAWRQWADSTYAYAKVAIVDFSLAP